MQRILLLAVLCALLVSPSAAHASATGVVISQVYGGGGNSTSSFQNDFVELFNAGTTAVDISGWTVQYATAAGTSWQTTALSGTISAGHYYLVQLASSATTGAPLPTPDATGTTNVAATSGKVAVVRGTAAIACGASAGSCSADALVEDLVGYGGAGDFEGTGSAPAASNALSAQRASAGCVDTGDNAADFTSAAPTPRNSSSPAESCAGRPGSGAGGSVRIDVDVASSLSISLDRSSVSFGTTSSGATPTPLAVNATVSSNNVGGYALTVARTAFSPNDLPLGIAANAPGGATLAAALAGGALVAVPAQPGPAFVIGTRATPSAAAGDIWPTRIGFSSPLPLVGAGRYTATVTYTATAQ